MIQITKGRFGYPKGALLNLIKGDKAYTLSVVGHVRHKFCHIMHWPSSIPNVFKSTQYQ